MPGSRAEVTTEAAITADFRTIPYLHQLREFELSAEASARALLWQMRTGKTKLAVDTACHQARDLGLDAVVVLAPNGVHRNWLERELPAHHWDSVPHRTLHWDTAIAGQTARASRSGEALERHKAWWATAKEMLGDRGSLPWFSFASETVTRSDVRRLLARVVRRRGHIMLVVDESDDYGKPGSKKTMMVRALARRCTSRRILSGTVVENGPLRAFSQYELLQPGALGFDRFEDFENRYAVYERKVNRKTGRSYPKLREYANMDELREHMATWSSVVLREDCQDLPELVRSSRRVTLTDEQRRLYRELTGSSTVTLSDDLISVGEVTNLMIKLQQVTSGYLTDSDGVEHTVPGDNPRLEACVDEVDLAGGSCIVWCAFRREMDAVAEALRARDYEVLEYHGRTSNADRERVRRLLAPGAGGPSRPLVAHARSAGRGLNLSRAGKIVWYSHTADAVLRSQADERATEVGGGNVSVVDLVASPTDEYILNDLVGAKVSLADDLARVGLQGVLRRIAL